MTEIEFAPRARADVDDIERYLRGEVGQRRTKTVLRRIRDRISILMDHPRVGRVREEYGGRRLLTCWPYVALYTIKTRADREIVVVLRIVHGARDIPTLLADE
ncbi:MAG: type II toxin-antitoxin system RelE/ParE family toxin [Caulobacteraceae bacterium]